MAARIKTTLSLDEGTVRFLEISRKRRGISRSRIVEEALLLARRNEMAIDLREGYLSMNGENLKNAEEALDAAREALE